jgi:hypothetical protein
MTLRTLMSAGRAWFGVVIVAVSLSSAPFANADTMFFLNGTDPIPIIPPPVKSQAWMAALLSGRCAGDTLINVNYPASVWPLTFDRPTVGGSVRIGADMTEKLLRTTAGERTVVGISQGALVADEVQRRLADDPYAPQPDQVTFVMIADPTRPGGVFSLLPTGTYIPILDLTTGLPPDSQYDSTVIVQQYDGVADFPDRPWNVVAVANALMGILYYHLPPDYYLHVEIPSGTGVSTSSLKGGTTTTYLIPSPELPLTKPLRDLGVPAELADRLDDTLRPIVDAGYSRLTPEAGPHIENGRLSSVKVVDDNTSPSETVRSTPRTRSPKAAVGISHSAAAVRESVTGKRSVAHSRR